MEAMSKDVRRRSPRQAMTSIEDKNANSSRMGFAYIYANTN